MVIGEIVIVSVAYKPDGFVPSATTAIKIIAAEDFVALLVLTTFQTLVFDSDL